MVTSRLHQIFDAYISKFDEINGATSTDPTEYYKWEAAKEFSEFDFESSEDFVSRLRHLKNTCGSLIDQSASYPFSALIKCAGEEGSDESDTVRKLFLDLFIDEPADDAEKQKRIDAFIRDSNALAKKNNLGLLSQNTQTSVMAYLGLRNPKDNFLLSTSKARELADRVGFDDDWGTLANFKLDVYNRFCGALREEIMAYHPLLEKSNSRFSPEFGQSRPKLKPMYTGEDPVYDLNLLVFDIIHCSSDKTNYGIGSCCPVDKELSAKIAEASRREQLFQNAYAAKEILTNAEKYWQKYLVAGTGVTHSKLGKGVVSTVEAKGDYTYFTVDFNEQSKPVMLWFENAALESIVSFDIPDYEIVGKDHRAVLLRKAQINKNYDHAQHEMLEYSDYL